MIRSDRNHRPIHGGADVNMRLAEHPNPSELSTLQFSLGTRDLRLSTNLVANAIANLLTNFLPNSFGSILGFFTRNFSSVFREPLRVHQLSGVETSQQAVSGPRRPSNNQLRHGNGLLGLRRQTAQRCTGTIGGALKGGERSPLIFAVECHGKECEGDPIC